MCWLLGLDTISQALWTKQLQTTGACMADIFVSYKRADQQTIEPLVTLLEAQGWSVWWDQRIRPGDRWDAMIEREIMASRCVVVIWSVSSVDSLTARWVHTEANNGMQRGILVPAKIAKVEPPLAFSLIQTSDLSLWDGTKPDPTVFQFLAAVKYVLDGHIQAVAPPQLRSQTDPSVVNIDGTYNRYTWVGKASIGKEPFYEDSARVWFKRIPPRMINSDTPSLLFVIADGMGYDGNGAEASRVAADNFVETFACNHHLAMGERLCASLSAANDSIAEAVRANEGLLGMGAVLLACHFDEVGFKWVSVGDCSLYLFREGEIAAINENHSLAVVLDQIAAGGNMSLAQAKADRRRRFLRSALTGGELELVDTAHHNLKLIKGDRLILGSQGLSTLDPPKIAKIVAEVSPQSIASALIAAVLAAGDPEQPNTTVVILRVNY